MTDVAVAAEIPLFHGLSEAQMRAVGSVMRRRSVRSGEVILKEGEPGRSLFVLTRGSVEATKLMGAPGADGSAPRRKVLVHMSAPQSFGEIGLLEDSPRSATVRAATDCDVLELRREDFEGLLSSDVHLAYVLVRNIATSLIQRLRRTDRDMIKLTVALSIALGNR